MFYFIITLNYYQIIILHKEIKFFLLQYAINVEKQIIYHLIQPSSFIIEVEGLAQGQGQ